jgi:hypothetical protein
MKTEILGILQKYPIIKKQQLLSQLAVSDGIITHERQVRQAIEELIKDGELIQSSERGYSLITTEQQLAEARTYLKKKATSIAVRYNCLTRNWNAKFQQDKKQMELFY